MNCQGGFSLALDRWDDGEWILAWSPVVAACLSPPVIIDEGELFSDTIFISGAFPDESATAGFDTAEHSGMYRIRWLSAYRSIEEGQASGASIPEEYRVSNSFQLATP